MSMGIVGVKSTAGREVKFIDPSKTTKSESTWLGYPLCVLFCENKQKGNQSINQTYTHTHTYLRSIDDNFFCYLFFHNYIHYTMKNEGWGFKEDQIPSSSHLLHQTMGPHLQFPNAPYQQIGLDAPSGCSLNFVGVGIFCYVYFGTLDCRSFALF